ncbi:MAG: cytochrome c family protein [Desulfarculaceae bacterium]|nr:cytochrome c family protein [Desulfarculaceae bacterium]
MKKSRMPWAVSLALLAMAMLLATGPAAAKSAINSLSQLVEHYDSARCAECHGEIYQQWSRSHHARSMMGLNNFSFMSKYLKKGPLSVKKPQDATLANFPCAKCHLPQLLATNDRVAKELAEVVWRDDKATVAKLNIGCLVCHQDKAVVHHRPDTRALYGGREIEEHEGAFRAVKKSRFMSSPAFCGQCHGLGPNFEFTPPIQCATLYGSYLHAYVASGGSQSCLDCHKRGSDHTFPPDFSDKAATGKLYARALPMSVEVLPYTFHPGHGENFPRVVLTASIQNQAGHRLPDG